MGRVSHIRELTKRSQIHLYTASKHTEMHALSISIQTRRRRTFIKINRKRCHCVYFYFQLIPHKNITPTSNFTHHYKRNSLKESNDVHDTLNIDFYWKFANKINVFLNNKKQNCITLRFPAIFFLINTPYIFF